MIVINPFREMVSDDDGWAYARSVQHLVTTGKYQLDPWSAANMPVQIYLAAGLSKLAGYSLRLLRFTTLALLVVGLGSLYALLREISSTKKRSQRLDPGAFGKSSSVDAGISLHVGCSVPRLVVTLSLVIRSRDTL
jgi:hypothetical protein